MKRLQNSIALRLKYLPPTNNLGSRIKVIQTNINKSKVIDFDYRMDNMYEQVMHQLNNIKAVKNYSLIIDNCQSDYVLININFNTPSFINLLELIK